MSELPAPIQALIERYQSGAPIKVGALASELGLGVLRSTLQPGISGQIEPSQEYAAKFVIRINRHEAKNRQRFTIAHEIGHFLLHKDRIGNGISDTILYRSKLSNALEAEANRFAADLLMPLPLVKKYVVENRLKKDEEASAFLAEKFEVSEEAMLIRLGLR